MRNYLNHMGNGFFIVVAGMPTRMSAEAISSIRFAIVI